MHNSITVFTADNKYIQLSIEQQYSYTAQHNTKLTHHHDDVTPRVRAKMPAASESWSGLRTKPKREAMAFVGVVRARSYASTSDLTLAAVAPVREAMSACDMPNACMPMTVCGRPLTSFGLVV